MSQITFNIPLFRERFPAFADTGIYTDQTLTVYWDMASCYIFTDDYGWLHGSCREQAVQLMTAHIAQLSVWIASGQVPTLLNSATIDKVSVSASPPPVKDQLQWWLSLTGYGQQLWALLSMKSVGGFYIGGSNVIGAYRNPNGSFGKWLR